MRNSRSLAWATAIGLSVLAHAAPAAAEPATFLLDPSHVTIAFSVGHIGYADTHGLFTETTGSFVFDETTNTLSELEATVVAASVFSGHERRDNHVRNADFLDAEVHPEIRFVMTDAVAESETTGQIVGDLTIRGVTRSVTLDVTLNQIADYPFPANNPNYVLGVDASTTIQRSEWGMTYAVDNGLVGDAVEIRIGAEAIRQD